MIISHVSHYSALSVFLGTMFVHSKSSYFHQWKKIFFKDFIYLFLERGEGREKDRKRNISVWWPLTWPQLGTWPATQACALTGNQTDDLLVHRPMFNPLSYNSQGRMCAFCNYSIFFLTRKQPGFEDWSKGLQLNYVNSELKFGIFHRSKGKAITIALTVPEWQKVQV